MSLNFSSYPVDIQDEGVSQGSATSINFTGSLVTASVSGNTATVNVVASTTPTPVMRIANACENGSRWTVSGFDGGFSTDGLSISTGASSGNTTKCLFNVTKNANFGLYAGSPMFSCQIFASSLNAASGSGSSFWGIGSPTVAGSGHTYTDRHIGFKILKSGGTVSLYGTQANGTTETATSALTTIANNDVLDLICVVNGTSSVDYYYRKNGGSLSSATNLTTNMPSGTSTQIQLSVSNNSTAFDFAFFGANIAYER